MGLEEKIQGVPGRKQTWFLGYGIALGKKR